MKKLGFIFVFVLSSLLVFAEEEQGIVKTVADDTFEVVGEIYDSVKSAVVEIGTALEVPAKHVYAVLVKQAVVESVSLLLGLGSLIIIVIVWIIIWWRLSIKDVAGYSDRTAADSDNIISVVIGFIALAILGIVTAVNMSDIITGFINPEYAAIKDIIQAIK